MIGFRPRLGPTLFTVPAFLILIGLGTWQIERLGWKEALIAERKAGLEAPVTIWADAKDRLAELAWRRVAVPGRFLNDREFLLAARSLNGNPGFHVVTPFAAEDGSVVIIDRGWIPLDRKAPATREAGRPESWLIAVGVVRPAPQKTWLTPDNHPGDTIWYWIDLPTVAGAVGGGRVLTTAYLEADATPNPGGLPIGGQTRIDLPNDHLQYAITWYALAVALVVIYVVYHRQNLSLKPPELRP
jgi:surfeit locus 1 family protein